MRRHSGASQVKCPTSPRLPPSLCELWRTRRRAHGLPAVAATNATGLAPPAGLPWPLPYSRHTERRLEPLVGFGQISVRLQTQIAHFSELTKHNRPPLSAAYFNPFGVRVGVRYGF